MAGDHNLCMPEQALRLQTDQAVQLLRAHNVMCMYMHQQVRLQLSTGDVMCSPRVLHNFLFPVSQRVSTTSIVALTMLHTALSLSCMTPPTHFWSVLL